MTLPKVVVTEYIPRPGDVLAYAGRDFVSRVVQIATMSWYSHVAIVGRPRTNDILATDGDLGNALHYGDQLMVFESTGNFPLADAFTNKRMDGFQAHLFEAAITARLLKGRVFVFRLAEPLDWRENHKLCEFLLNQYGKKYDYHGAIRAATRIIKLFFREDDNYWFCSELVGQALEEVGRWEQENSSLQTPKSLISDGLQNGIFGEAFEVIAK